MSPDASENFVSFLSGDGVFGTAGVVLAGDRLSFEPEAARRASGPLGEPPRRFVTAALADAHVHLRNRADFDQAMDRGVTALRDMGGRHEVGLAMAYSFPGAVATCGAALCPAGGYGAFLGRPVRDRAAAEEEMSRLADQGAAFVKLIASGVVDTEAVGRVGPGGFDSETIRVLVRAAGDRGLPVAVHANGDDVIRSAIRAGVRSIEHGFFMARDTLRMMAREEVCWVPTVHALAVLGPSGPRSATVVEETVHRHLDRLAEADDAGVSLALGTDAGAPGVGHGRSVFREIETWFGAGIPLGRVFRASLRGARKLAGLPDDPGTWVGVSVGTDGRIEGTRLSRTGRLTAAGRRWLFGEATTAFSG